MVAFVEAAHHGGARPTTHFIVIHTTENTQGVTTAMDIANFFAHEVNPTSAHGVVDDHQLVRCVRDPDEAYHCGTHGNAAGLGLEHIGRAAMTAAEWNTPYTDAMLKLSAGQIAAWCRLYSIPAVKIGAQDLLLGKRGICGHNDVRAAWPQDTTHTDPGRYWPWSKHLGYVNTILHPAPPKPPEEDMFVYYVEAGDTTGAGYIRFSNGRTHVTAAEAEGRRAVGEKVAAVVLPISDPFWVLPIV